MVYILFSLWCKIKQVVAGNVDFRCKHSTRASEKERSGLILAVFKESGSAVGTEWF